MCGIAGFVGKGNQDDLAEMVGILEHRGPDDTNFWVDRRRRVFFGHTRLSIIDIEGGVQPMWSRDKKLCVIFNGEIYNFSELRVELEKKGHRFETDHSDTEVLLYAYKEWGEKMPTKLNGMWAFVIYDLEKGVLFCSRDRFGKKPFYYHLNSDCFVFASELSSLVKHPGVRRAVSERSLHKYFAYGYFPQPLTIYKHIFKLESGSNLVYDLETKKVSVKKYWNFRLEPFEKIPDNPEEVWGEKTRYLLEKSVKRRLVSDVPLGVFLSGGVDSSAVATYAAKHVDNGKLKTFTVGFDEKSFDELDYAIEVAKKLNTEHHFEVLSLEKALELIPEIIHKLDEPMGDSSLIPTYLLSNFTRKYVTVALSGDGGDELFAGYDPYKALKLAKLYSMTVPKPVHKSIELLAGKIPVSNKYMSFDFIAKRTLRGLGFSRKLWNPVWLSPLKPAEISKLFKTDIDVEDLYSEAIEIWDQSSTTSLVDKTIEFYTKMYLTNGVLTKVDRASMMNSLEVRSPFLDIDLVNFVRKIPSNYKYRNGTTKYILRKALEPILLNKICNRSKKGFGVPISRWFRAGSLQVETKSKLIPNTSFANKLVRDHKKGVVDQRLFLWNLFVLNNYKV